MKRARGQEKKKKKKRKKRFSTGFLRLFLNRKDLPIIITRLLRLQTREVCRDLIQAKRLVDLIQRQRCLNVHFNLSNLRSR